MAYNAFSLTQGEVASPTKWNYLGGNDELFDNQVGAGLGSTSSTAGWQELDRTVLSSAADSISSATFTARKYLKIIIFIDPVVDTVDAFLRFNGDSGNNYSSRQSVNGAADGSSTSASKIYLNAVGTTYSSSTLIICDVMNVSANEKLVYGKRLTDGGGSAAVTPTRIELTGKWTNTSSQITSVSLTNTAGGDYGISSMMIILGHD